MSRELILFCTSTRSPMTTYRFEVPSRGHRLFRSFGVITFMSGVTFPAAVPKLPDGLSWYQHQNNQALINRKGLICMFCNMSGEPQGTRTRSAVAEAHMPVLPLTLMEVSLGPPKCSVSRSVVSSKTASSSSLRFSQRQRFKSCGPIDSVQLYPLSL